jgi:hypothetical protein
MGRNVPGTDGDVAGYPDRTGRIEVGPFSCDLARRYIESQG